MKIVYNPKDGAPIKGFQFKGVQVDAHYPDGYKYSDGTHANGLLQYEDETGDAILETFQFLEEWTPDQVKKRVAEPVKADGPELKCEFCEFTTTTPIALSGHMRSHKNDKPKSLEAPDAGSGKPPVEAGNVAPAEVNPTSLVATSDELGIPVASGQKIKPIVSSAETLPDEKETQNGVDSQGVEWYGDGIQVENRSQEAFGATKVPGQGHFRG